MVASDCSLNPEAPVYEPKGAGEIGVGCPSRSAHHGLAPTSTIHRGRRPLRPLSDWFTPVPKRKTQVHHTPALGEYSSVGHSPSAFSTAGRRIVVNTSGSGPTSPIQFPVNEWRSKPQSRQAKAQQRTAAHRLSKKQKAQAKLKEGLKEFLPSLSPSVEKLLKSSRKATDDDQQRAIEETIAITAEQIHQARVEEEEVLEQLLSEWTKGAVGFIPSAKPDNTVRFYLENVNSLSWFDPDKTKFPDLKKKLDQYDIDHLQMIETGTNFDSSQVLPSDPRFTDKFGVGKERKCICAHNMHLDVRCLTGGTAQLTFGALSTYVLEQGADPTGLGRFVWTKVGMHGGKQTYLITAYQACDNHRPGSSTALTQQADYFAALGDDRNPRTIFLEHLLLFIAECRAQNAEVMLYIDANENVYTGRLGRALSGPDLNMREQFLHVTGQQAPASHHTGSHPITGTFATPGIRIVNIFQSSHKAGVGDHRYTVVDVDATSLIGVPLRHVKRPATRMLQMEVQRNVARFNKCLEELVDRHRMFKKLDNVRASADTEAESHVQASFSKWDNQMTELTKGAQKKGCGKKYAGQHDSSSTLSFWLARLCLWRRVKEHKIHPLPDPRNLKRELESQGYPRPRDISMETVDARILALEAKYEEVKAEARSLRKDHLHLRLDRAKEKDDETAILAITRIIKKERQKRRGQLPTRCMENREEGPFWLFKSPIRMESCSLLILRVEWSKRLLTNLTHAFN